MRIGYEFRFHRVDANRGDAVVDPTLDLLGSQGWHLVGITSVVDGVMCALERTIDRDAPLPDSDTLAAALTEPLLAPAVDTLEMHPREIYEGEA